MSVSPGYFCLDDFAFPAVGFVIDSVPVASPADVIRRLMIYKSLGTTPDAGGAWPIYAAAEPGTPDNCITVYDTQGKDDGRLMMDGRKVFHRGFQVRIRSVDHPTGYAKAWQLADALDTQFQRDQITVDGISYCVAGISRGDVVIMGKEAPSSFRRLFTINGTAYMTQSA